jgi:hypothetical protein
VTAENIRQGNSEKSEMADIQGVTSSGGRCTESRSETCKGIRGDNPKRQGKRAQLRQQQWQQIESAAEIAREARAAIISRRETSQLNCGGSNGDRCNESALNREHEAGNCAGISRALTRKESSRPDEPFQTHRNFGPFVRFERGLCLSGTPSGF